MVCNRGVQLEARHELESNAQVPLHDPVRFRKALSLSVAPVWGNASSGAERLWGLRDAGSLAPEGEFEAGQRLDAKLAYEGTWRAGMRHGAGTETLRSGLSRRCTWKWGEVVRETCTPTQ